MGSHSLRHQLVLWTLSVAVIAAGAYLSHIRFLGEEWLSRSGCLVVVLGIWSGIGGILHERVLAGRVRFQRRRAVARAAHRLRRQKVDEERMQKELDSIGKAFDDKLQAISEDLRLSVGILEVSLLVTGTLIWGFGDLVRLL